MHRERTVDKLKDWEFMDKLCEYLNATDSNENSIGTVNDIIEDLYEFTNDCYHFLLYFRTPDVIELIQGYLDDTYRTDFCYLDEYNHLRLLNSEDIAKLRNTYSDVIEQYFYQKTNS